MGFWWGNLQERECDGVLVGKPAGKRNVIGLLVGKPAGKRNVWGFGGETRRKDPSGRSYITETAKREGVSTGSG